MKHYIVAYDILNDKRAVKVRKLVYSYALGGQKSALEVPLTKKELEEFVTLLEPLLSNEDRVNIIEVEEEPLLFGKADVLTYDKGVIIL
jgi:CRISPR-associated endonuclease Cas2